MAHSKIMNGEDGLQIWTLETNISIKQSWTTNKVWSSSLRV